MTSIEPLFNLKAVVRQTGIKPDTLRAWVRRYGLPRLAAPPVDTGCIRSETLTPSSG